MYRLREAGLSVRVFEAGGDVGGTWYWNRYPGARFDSESWTYGYSFSEDMLQEWEWSEHFSAQPETLRYLNYVADKFDLRRDIEFNTRITAATYDESAHSWTVDYEGGSASARFLVAAIGLLSVPTLPTIEGMESFEGQAFHTGEWPHEPLDFHGKRVAVIGTGATGVQVIQEVAKTAGTLTVFQRRPNWCAPLHNSAITDEEQRKIKSSYPEIFALCSETFGAFVHRPDERMALQVTPEEREALWEKLYAEPGFGIWMANFRDLLLVEEANKLISEFIARKIRERVHDPAVAEKLIPKDHGFGTRRLPLESGYYEVYNQDNVALVDLHGDAAGAHHSGRDQDHGGGVRVRHHHLRHRLRRYHRRVRPDRHSGRRRPPADRPLGRRPADVPGHAICRLPQPARDRRPAQRHHLLQHDSMRGAQRRLDHGPHPLHARTLLHKRRSHQRGRGGVDKAHRRDRLDVPVHEGRFLVHGNQPQPSRKAAATRGGLPGRRARLPRALRRGRRQRLRGLRLPVPSNAAMATDRRLIRRAYDAFNARDIDAALALLHPEVEWPNGMEGGYVHGHAEVRDYWTRQWTLIDPRVTPERLSTAADGRTVVDVHQVVRDLDGNVLSDRMVGTSTRSRMG